MKVQAIILKNNMNIIESGPSKHRKILSDVDGAPQRRFKYLTRKMFIITHKMYPAI